MIEEREGVTQEIRQENRDMVGSWWTWPRSGKKASVTGGRDLGPFWRALQAVLRTCVAVVYVFM